ncbi:metallophosphoesterase [Megasphaera cerevisiae]|nr:metallophosphoesterase [Megasphaera cerevisiae]
MISMSCIAVFSIALWNYMFRSSRKVLVACAAVSVTIIAAGELAYYSTAFPELENVFHPVLFYGSLAALSWLFMFFFAFPVLLIGAICCFFIRMLRPRHRPETKERKENTAAARTVTRRTFIKGTAAAIPLAAVTVSAGGTFAGESYLDTTYHRLAFPRLPDYLDGYKIGQLSDLHMGLFFSPRRLQESLDALAAAGVNRVEITGDLIDELSLLPACRQILQQNASRFPDGMDFCYGNHEYYRGFNQITAMLEETPVRIMRNSHIVVSTGRGNGMTGCTGKDDRPFYIAGTDYSFAKGDKEFSRQREAYVQKTLQGIPTDAFVVMLAHHSAFIDEAFRHNIPLTLCGHTHGAQVALIGPLVQAVGFKYLRGMFASGRCRGYVNRGTGHWLPLRVLCSREVSVFELKQKN